MMRRKLITLLLASLSLLLVARAASGIWLANGETHLLETAAARAENHVSNKPSRAHAKNITPASVNAVTMLANKVISTAQAEPIQELASAHNSELMHENAMLADLRKQKDSLDKREAQLNRKEKLLQQAEDKINRRITELEQLEAGIKQRLKDEQGIKNKKLKRMTAVFEGMKPERAASVIAKMDLATVVRIFSLMNEKKVGKILSFLPADKAVSISQALTRQISST
jgi:flagellar motility protein MotE (MotC chaperone)